jgi:hypothetical protein
VDASVGLVEGQLVGAPEQDAAGLARVQHPGHLHHALRPTGHRHFAAQLRLLFFMKWLRENEEETRADINDRHERRKAREGSKMGSFTGPSFTQVC